MDRVVVIAEAGVNHNGSLRNAKLLVEAAAKAGADIVKFQTFRAEQLVTKNAQLASYQKASCAASAENQLEMLRRLELSPEEFREVAQYCKECGIRFLSTAFDVQSVDLLNDIGMHIWKIPSGDITNLPLLRRIGALGQPVYLSSGMASLGEIESALEILSSAGASRDIVTVLHCNTEYPTPYRDVNLRAIQTIQQSFGVRVGYSDHTVGIEVPIAAVALGAEVIEKHFTLDRKWPGPDQRSSMEPKEFTTMVNAIRNISAAMGSQVKRPSESEEKNRVVVRRSIVAAKRIKVGEEFTNSNLTVKRPGVGVSPMMWDLVVGKKAGRDYEVDEMIEII